MNFRAAPQGDKNVTIRVVLNAQTPTRYEIHVGEQSIAVERSATGDGEASGPTPHDLYDAALAACTALTVRWYATHKHIALQSIEVSVARDASQERAGTYRLGTTLGVTGDLKAAQREELLRVVQQCPVHRLMTEVRTEISTALSP
jgi:putative redox protein